MATALAANAATVGTAVTLTTANCTALAALVQILASNPSIFNPIHRLLSDTNKASISGAV